MDSCTGRHGSLNGAGMQPEVPYLCDLLRRAHSWLPHGLALERLP